MVDWSGIRSEVGSATAWCSHRAIPSVVAASALAIGALVGGPLLIGARTGPDFLVWNLILAWAPYLAAVRLEALGRRGRRGDAIFYGALWLLFLPNAPYLVSDLSHFDRASATPWLDLGTLVAFAWAGLLLGVVSMRLVQQAVERELGALAGWTVVVGAAMASGFGVALGRFGRVNSWQIVTSPGAVAAEAATVLASGRLLAVAAFFGVLLLAVYVGGPSLRSSNASGG